MLQVLNTYTLSKKKHLSHKTVIILVKTKNLFIIINFMFFNNSTKIGRKTFVYKDFIQ